MRHDLLASIWRQIRANPRWLKRLKILASLAAMMTFFIGGVFVWAGYKLVDQVARSAAQIDLSAEAMNWRTQVSQLRMSNCWEAASSLIHPTQILGGSLEGHLEVIKAACVESKSIPQCQDEECRPGFTELEKESFI